MVKSEVVVEGMERTGWSKAEHEAVGYTLQFLWVWRVPSLGWPAALPGPASLGVLSSPSSPSPPPSPPPPSPSFSPSSSPLYGQSSSDHHADRRQRPPSPAHLADQAPPAPPPVLIITSVCTSSEWSNFGHKHVSSTAGCELLMTVPLLSHQSCRKRLFSISAQRKTLSWQNLRRTF